MHSIKISETIEINERQETIFDYTQDYNNRLTWDTFLIEARLINGAEKAGLGVRAYCVAKNRLGMETEYVSFNRPKVTAIKMTKGPHIFKSFQGSWNFKALNTKKTQVIFLYSFEFNFPFNLLSSFIKSNLQKNVRQRLNDLKICLEKENLK